MSVFRTSRYARSVGEMFVDARRGAKLSLRPYVLGPFTAEVFTIYTVLDGDTFESLAHKFYGDSSKWWAIAQANREREDLFFPLNLAGGMVIKVPAVSLISRT